MLTKSASHAAVVLALLAGFLSLVSRRVSSEPYVYDEADYMYAASRGFIANSSDTPTLPMRTFLEAGLGRRNDAKTRQDLSAMVRRSDDVALYRHWHGPVFYYLLTPLSRAGLDEHGVRMAMLAIPMASVVVLYLGCLLLVPGLSGFLAAILAATLFLSSYAVIASTELAPHQLFVLCSLCFLFLLAKATTTGRLSYWYGAVCAAAIAFCTFELALVPILTLGICGYFERRKFHTDWIFITRSLALFLATVLVVWPAAILKASFVKSYLVLAYMSLFRRSPWGAIGFLDTWTDRVVGSPLEWTVILLGLVLFFRERPMDRRIFYPALVYALLMIVATLRVFSDTPRYALPFMPELDLFAGLAVSTSIERLRRPARIAVVCALILGTYGAAEYRNRLYRPNSNPRSAAILSFIHRNHLNDKALLVPQDELPMIHYYFPASTLRGYFTPNPESLDALRSKPDAILYRSYPVQFELGPIR